MAQGVNRTKEEVIGLVQSLLPYLQCGTSLKKACHSCKMPYTSILEYMDRYEEVRTIIEASESYLDAIAENIIANKIIKERDVNTSKWWLERSQKEKYSINSKVLNEEVMKGKSESLQVNVVIQDTWHNLKEDKEKMMKLTEEERCNMLKYLDKMEIRLINNNE